jgi:DNA-binding transcriptional regulator YiaG
MKIIREMTLGLTNAFLWEHFIPNKASEISPEAYNIIALVILGGVLICWLMERRNPPPSKTKESTARTLTPKQIRNLRKRLGLSGVSFAEALGLTGRHRGLLVYKWESGKKRPGPQSILMMRQLQGRGV